MVGTVYGAFAGWHNNLILSRLIMSDDQTRLDRRSNDNTDEALSITPRDPFFCLKVVLI